MRTKAAILKDAAEYGVNFLLSVDSDPKTAKSNKAGAGYFTAIQYLAPAMASGHQVCSSASAGCIAACLHTAGVPFMLKAKTKARIARTRLFFENRPLYLELLFCEIDAFIRRCEKMGLKPAIRLNGTSDIVWEKVCPEIFKRYPNVQWYDYTKHVKRCVRGWKLPKNYSLTFSKSESNDAELERVLRDRICRVAVVFSTTRTKDLPKVWQGFKVGDIDKDDLRFLDKGFRVGGLRAKGKARQDTSGFVVKVA